MPIKVCYHSSNSAESQQAGKVVENYGSWSSSVNIRCRSLVLVRR